MGITPEQANHHSSEDHHAIPEQAHEYGWRRHFPVRGAGAARVMASGSISCGAWPGASVGKSALRVPLMLA
ncbi:hypothetical protein [Metallibacterium sp.]|uniref:hypothetical protein n=1 Tax=Metallibacterium sp. TaxID=2940281 RepID=UPI0026234D67|nr:hypothetical protein [Metallibacterium sp.]